MDYKEKIRTNDDEPSDAAGQQNEAPQYGEQRQVGDPATDSSTTSADSDVGAFTAAEGSLEMSNNDGETAAETISKYIQTLQIEGFNATSFKPDSPGADDDAITAGDQPDLVAQDFNCALPGPPLPKCNKCKILHIRTMCSVTSCGAAYVCVPCAQTIEYCEHCSQLFHYRLLNHKE